MTWPKIAFSGTLNIAEFPDRVEAVLHKSSFRHRDLCFRAFT
jgi:hypothetical protein